VKIDGVGNLKSKLRRLPRVAKEEIRKGLEQSATEIVDLMKRMAPVESGKLRDSIGWTWGAPPDGAMVFTKVVGDAGLAITIYAGSNETYVEGERVDFQNAFLQEFGTIKMKANPFFRPAWRFSRKRAQSRVNRALGKAARKVAAGS